jgi:hypothetical protein
MAPSWPITGEVAIPQHRLEIEVLVLQRVDELVRERDAQVDRHLGAPHADAFAERVVVGERGGVGQVVRRLQCVEVGRQQPERAQRGGPLLDQPPVLVRGDAVDRATGRAQTRDGGGRQHP